MCFEAISMSLFNGFNTIGRLVMPSFLLNNPYHSVNFGWVAQKILTLLTRLMIACGNNTLWLSDEVAIIRFTFDCSFILYEKINFFLLLFVFTKRKSKAKKIKHFRSIRINPNQYQSLWAAKNVLTKIKSKICSSIKWLGLNDYDFSLNWIKWTWLKAWHS